MIREIDKHISRTTSHSLSDKSQMYSEKHEDFLDVTFDVLDFLSDNVESNGLGKGSALTYSDNITLSKSESWGAVNSNSVMSLLKSVVLFDIVQVITSNDNGILHFS